jgi:hypothetical protein
VARETTYAGKFGDWQRLLEPLLANAADLAHLQMSRDKLSALAAQGVSLTREQAVHQASKQQVTRRLQSLVVDADRLVTLLRQAVKEHYGIRSEKLTEFGLQPFRGRPRTPRPPALPEEPLPAAPRDSATAS